MHSRLGFRLETAGDRNGDGVVDWVDAGIAYRDRYVKEYAGPVARGRLRDGFRMYYAVHGSPSYRQAFEKLGSLEFADGIWWMKGMMEPASWDDWEAHKFAVFPMPGSASWADKAAMAPGPDARPVLRSHYIVLDRGFVDEFGKRIPDGRPYRYSTGRGRTRYYKDNVRSLASGALFDALRVVSACLLGPGDSVMLDAFSAFARSGYDPAGTAGRVERRRASDCRLPGAPRDAVAGEAWWRAQDTVAYGAYAMLPTDAVTSAGGSNVTAFAACRCWRGLSRCRLLRRRLVRVPASRSELGDRLVYGSALGLAPAGEHAWRKIALLLQPSLVWSEMADLKVGTCARTVTSSRSTTTVGLGCGPMWVAIAGRGPGAVSPTTASHPSTPAATWPCCARASSRCGSPAGIAWRSRPASPIVRRSPLRGGTRRTRSSRGGSIPTRGRCLPPVRPGRSGRLRPVRAGTGPEAPMSERIRVLRIITLIVGGLTHQVVALTEQLIRRA